MRGSLTGTQTVTVTNKPRDSEKKRAKKMLNVRRVATAVPIVLGIAYVSIAALIRFSVRVQSLLIYVNFVRIPFFGDLTKPAEFGLRNTRHFDLTQYDGCPIGTWHVLPDTYVDNVTDASDYVSSLSDGATIVLYLHGNTGTRGTRHRVQQYQSLAERGYHVITFDYRGFGDSPCSPSERGMMEDALLVWDWIQTRTPESRVFIWGHSLGSAAATYLAKELWDKRSVYPEGVVLDAPFPSVLDAASNHPFGLPYWPVMSLFRYFVIESFQERFESESRLKNIPFPLLIAHGHNDIIIPFDLGRRMYETASEARQKNPFLHHRVYFIDCGEASHKTNFKSSQLQQALDWFIDGDM